MNLEQIAQQAMDYLDSVGVAAEWEIGAGAYRKYGVIIFTDDKKMAFMRDMSARNVLEHLKYEYPAKSPD